MTHRSSTKKPPRPLDETRMEELAVAYVGRFATTRAKLTAYLARKLRERGWAGSGEPETKALAERLAGLGYIDDAAFALARARSLGQRGYGPRRVTMVLRRAGVAEEDGRAAEQASAIRAVAAALRFAQRRRIGPFSDGECDRHSRDKALAAMLRAGHEYDLARRIIRLAPERDADLPELVTRLSNLAG